MSEYEDTASKAGPKLENLTASQESMEELDEGQEEWLSEGILTDDDYHPVADNDSSVGLSQDGSAINPDDSEDMVNGKTHSTGDSQDGESKSYNIEEALDNMEKTDDNDDELPPNMGTLLVRKADGQIIETRDDSDMDESIRHSDDDGHDTDELLRVLGDGDQKNKNGQEGLLVPVTRERRPSSDDDDDDDDIFENSKVNRLKVAKRAILKKVPARAEPEDLSDEENMSPNESKQAKAPVVRRRGNYAAKSTTKSSDGHKKTSKTEQMKYKAKPAQKEQKRTYTVQSIRRGEVEEMVNGEEFLDEDAFDLEYQSDNRLDGEVKQQPIMSPERMDEEFPSDGESGSDIESLYDELPSSDSEDLNEWFMLDIRSERAGDYLPLLGDKAQEVLLEERERISSRVNSLRQNLAALTEGTRAQAAMLRRAAIKAAELDANIKAT